MDPHFTLKTQFRELSIIDSYRRDPQQLEAVEQTPTSESPSTLDESTNISCLAYSPLPVEFKKCIEHARIGIIKYITKLFSGQKVEKRWELKKELYDLIDNQSFYLEGFLVNGKEIKQLLRSVRISFHDQHELTEELISQFFLHDLTIDQNLGGKERKQLFDRCIASSVVWIRDLNGVLLKRDNQQPLKTMRVYTFSCSEIIENTDFNKYLDKSLVKNRLKKAYLKTYVHYLIEAKRDGIKNPILVKFDRHSFPKKFRLEELEALGEAIEAVMEIESFAYFDSVIFADQDGQVCTYLASKIRHVKFLPVTEAPLIKSYQAMCQNESFSLLNFNSTPLDIENTISSMTSAQILSSFSTFYLSHHPDLNPFLLDQSEYYKIDHLLFARHKIDTRVNREVYSSIANFMDTSIVNIIQNVPISPLGPQYVYLYKERSANGVCQLIGTCASLLISEGNSFKNAKEQKNIAHVEFRPIKGGYILRLSFKTFDYAKRLVETLVAIGISSATGSEVYRQNKYDLYRGELILNHLIDISTFVQVLCSLKPNDIQDLVNNKHINQNYANQLLNAKNLNLNYLPIEEHTLSIPRFKIFSNGVSKSIGAITSLLVHGLNSLKDAQNLKNIIHLEFTPKKFCLNFKEYNDAERLKRALNTPSLKGKFENMKVNKVKKSIDGYGEFLGEISCEHPETIVLFLRQVCKQHPRDIIDLVLSPNFNLLMGDKLKNSPFGQSIMTLAPRQLRYTSSEESTHKKRIHHEILDLNQFKVNPQHLKPLSISEPLLEDKENHLDKLVELLAEENNLEKNPILLKELLEEKDNPFTLVERMKYFIALLTNPAEQVNAQIEGLTPYKEMRKEWFVKMNSLFQHILNFLQEPGLDKVLKAEVLHNLAKAANRSAIHLSQVTVQSYYRLALRSHLIHPIGYTTELSQSRVETQLSNMIEKALALFREKIFNQLVDQIQATGLFTSYLVSQNKESSRIYYLQLIGKVRAIPGEELANYLQTYGSATNLLLVRHHHLEEAFDQKYTPAKIVNFLYKNLTAEGNPIFGNNALDLVIDFIGQHSLECMENSTSKEIRKTILENRGLSIKKTYLTQILNYFGMIEEIES